MANAPSSTIFSLVLSFLGLFAAVTFLSIFYYKRNSRRSERLELFQQATGEIISPEAYWSEAPAIWEVWADKYPKPTSKWEDLLPLSMTYDHDLLCTRQPPLRPSQVLSVPQSRGARQRSVGGAVDARLRQNRSSEGLQPILSTTDCNVSVFIAMPSPHEYFSAESGQEFVIGTADVMYRHPERPHS